MSDRAAALGSGVARPRWRSRPLDWWAISGVVLCGIFLLSAVAAEFIAPFEPNRQDYRAILQAPSLAHLMGTDQLGRDLLSRLIHGSRIALFVGVGSVGAAVVVGACLGLIAGYAGGRIDEAIMRLMDALLTFPSVLLALGIMAALGPGLVTIVIAIAVADLPVFARITRAQVLSLRERDFVAAAQALGAGRVRIIRRHIWPHITGPIIVLATLHVGFAILTEAALSFLGLGIQPPTASWGIMLKNGFSYMERAPWLSIFPGIAIFATVLGLNLIGDALREAWDPKSVGAARRDG